MEDLTGHIPLPVGACFFPALQGGNDDLGGLLPTWVHVLTRESKRSNPSNMDADVSTRSPPADTCDVCVCARVNLFSSHELAAAFFQDCPFFV